MAHTQQYHSSPNNGYEECVVVSPCWPHSLTLWQPSERDFYHYPWMGMRTEAQKGKSLQCYERKCPLSSLFSLVSHRSSIVPTIVLMKPAFPVQWQPQKRPHYTIKYQLPSSSFSFCSFSSSSSTLHENQRPNYQAGVKPRQEAALMSCSKAQVSRVLHMVCGSMPGPYQRH